MATYTSRHNPRKQATVAGQVLSLERYDRFYDIAWEALQAGVLRPVSLPAGRLLMRKANRDIEQARTLAPADFSSKALGVRYSGVRLSGGEGQGALYLATMAGLLREHVHYSGGAAKSALWQPGAADATKAAVKREIAGAGAAVSPAGAKYFHVYQLNSTLQLLDLRVQSLTTVFNSLLATPAATSRFGLSALTTAFLLVQTVLDPHDYSAARGMADAAFDWGRKRGLAGLVATSARGDSDSGVILYDHGDGVEGLVFALFGAAGQRLDVLTPLSSYATFQDLVAAVRAMPGFQPTV